MLPSKCPSTSAPGEHKINAIMDAHHSSGQLRKPSLSEGLVKYSHYRSSGLSSRIHAKLQNPEKLFFVVLLGDQEGVEESVGTSSQQLPGPWLSLHDPAPNKFISCFSWQVLASLTCN